MEAYGIQDRNIKDEVIVGDNMKKKWIKSLAVGTASSILASIILFILTIARDFFRDIPLLSTFGNILSAIMCFLSFELRTWWVLLGLGVLLCILFVCKRIFESAEITKLQNKLCEATKEIQEYKSPLDTAFYECEFELEYRRIPKKKAIGNSSTYKKTVKLPELFSVIATRMLNVSITEDSIKITIIKHFISNEYYSYSLTDSQIVKRILIQLEALKLVKSFWSGKHLYWSLTRQGEKVRNDMVLQKIV